MISKQVAWAVLLATISQVAHTLQFYIARSDCTFYYHSLPPNLFFDNCSASHSPYSTSWSSCFDRCCHESGQDKYDSPSYDAFSFCSSDESNQSAKLLGFRIAVIAVCTFLAVSICLFCIRRICKGKKSRVDVLDRPITKVEWQVQTEINNVQENIIWSSRSNKDSMLRFVEQPCPICLEDRTYAELFCRHQYHPKCLGQWINKSSECPVCRMKNIRGIKIYCQTCRWRYYIASKAFLSQGGHHLPSRCIACAGEQEGAAREGSSLGEFIPQQTQQEIFLSHPSQKKLLR